VRRRGQGGPAPRLEVEIRVRDTGPGIDEKVLANLFVPFVTTKNRGTGLGLAISQRIINAAGGTIEARSVPDQGTTFVVRLPASSPVEVAAPAPSPPASPEPNPVEGGAQSGAPGGDTASGLATNR
jgi:two-component system, NtrC family, sensor histidine kinase HydH